MRVLLMVALLAGCTTTEYVDRVVEVKINVPIACIDPSDVPLPMIYPVDELDPGVSDGDIIGALLADRDQRAAMEAALRNIIGACIGESL